ncbi:unnamed protein product [Cladocopium goreaui]|uniref:Mitochondrial RNA binding complex 1 subunit n=1 Tax=Cladocopium goreaui TaxID=2562237 RepID=A0A9P1D2I2_9DINO|nr:unnamed protein product [Cladocopium goreaui]
MLFRRFRWRCGTFSTLGGNAFFAKKVRNIQQAASGPPAHLVYDPSQLPDVATLLLVAKSAVSSDFKDQAFWQACSLQARKLCGADANLLALARYAVAAATVHHQDTELMYNIGDMAVAGAERNFLDAESIMLILQSHAILAFRNDRVLRKLELVLFEMLQQSKATAACLSSSLLSLSQLFSASVLPDVDQALEYSRQELIDGAARVCLEHISFFTAAQLCEVLEAMATFKVRGDRQVSALFFGIGNSLARQTSTLSSKDCGTISRAFAACRVHDEKILSSLAFRLRDKEVRRDLTAQDLANVLYGFAKFTSQDIALLDLLSIEVRRHLHALDVRLMSSTLASLAKCGVSCPVLTGRATQMLRRPGPKLEANEEDREVQRVCNLSLGTFNELLSLTMAFAKFQVRDSRLHERLAESLLQCQENDQAALEFRTCTDLVNVVHAFAKVHQAPIQLLGTVIRLLRLRPPGEFSTRDAVKLLHALAKIEYTILPDDKKYILLALGPEQLKELGVFELLKLAVAARKLGFELPSLETQVGVILPNEPPLKSDSPQRRPTAKKQRRKSARKQKWTW